MCIFVISIADVHFRDLYRDSFCDLYRVLSHTFCDLYRDSFCDLLVQFRDLCRNLRCTSQPHHSLCDVCIAATHIIFSLCDVQCVMPIAAM